MHWLFHRPIWEVVSVDCDEQLHYDTGGPSDASGHFFVTNVALRCAVCGNLRTRTLRGRHTKESLSGEEREISRIIERIQ